MGKINKKPKIFSFKKIKSKPKLIVKFKTP